jgi:hypothetical protein
MSNDLRFFEMVETCPNTIEIRDDTIKQIFEQGVRDWFHLGLKFSSKNSWKGEYWILDIVDKQKFLLAKIKYGF